MHDHDEHHQGIIESASNQLGEILENSEQAVYIYFDDNHKVCNKKFSDLLGFSSPEEWSKVEGPFPNAFVAEESQDTIVSAYNSAMENLVGSTNQITWKKKDSEEVKTTVILVPFVVEDHLLALHFVS